MNRWQRIGLVGVVLLALLLAWEPSRVAMQTAIMLPNLLGSGPQALTRFSPEPARSTVPYWPSSEAASDEEVELAELWLPAWASPDDRAGAMLLVFGVNNLGRNHPVIVRVADALARTGVAVLVPDSRAMLEGRLTGEEVDKIVAAFDLLAARPEVDPGRVGIVGFSVGGSLALVAAADPRISEQVRWVNAFGAFADAESYLASVAVHAYLATDGEVVPWQPTPLAREVFLNFVLGEVEDRSDRRALRQAYGATVLAGERPSIEPSLRGVLETDAADAVEALLTARDLHAARAAVDRLPTTTRDFARDITPVHHLDGLEADVYLMHERDDHHVPFVESRRLAEALRERGVLVTHTEFRLFDHVQPDDLDLVAAAPELWKLLWHLHALMVETL